MSPKMHRSSTGSSPLTRGKPLEAVLRGGGHGLNHAHAGKTSSRSSRGGSPEAHPRSRGENEARGTAWHPTQGSSPLTRGKRVTPPGPFVGPGLIPAHAGKTDTRRAAMCSTSAHPRSRGENVDGSGAGAGVPGSSPLTRGKRSLATFGNRRTRLIPAHAGKTCPCHLRAGSAQAHPRSRGENQGLVTTAVTWMGSSPLTRGKRAVVLPVAGLSGLIPAHAGKTGYLSRFA